MQTAIRFFDHLQEKFRQVMERELPNIDAAARMWPTAASGAENSMSLVPVIPI